jgi:hypothetical protein
MARKIKKAKVSKAAGKVMAKSFWGSEPIIDTTREITQKELGDALTWHNYNSDAKDARKWMGEYLSNIARADLKAQFAKIPDKSIPFTASYMARIANRGGQLTEKNKQFMLDSLTNSFRYAKMNDDEDKPTLPEKKGPTIQDRLNEKVSEMAGEVIGFIDDGAEGGLYDLLVEMKYPPMLAKMLVKRLTNNFTGQIAELREAIKSKDPQLKEGYGHLSKKELEAKAVVMETILAEAIKYADTAKAAKKPRVKKPQPPEKKVKNFKAHADTPTAPIKTLGKNEVWLFNTKNKVLTVLRGAGGIQIQGNKFYNFDEATSISKKVRDKALDPSLKTIASGGKRARDKLMETLTTKPTGLQYRGNPFTLILGGF